MATRQEYLDIAEQALSEGDEATAMAAMDEAEKLAPATPDANDVPRASQITDVPGAEQDAAVADYYAQQQPKQERGLGEKAIGAGEALLTIGTGATSGMLGQLAGTAAGIGKSIQQGLYGTNQGADMAEQIAMDTAAASTYSPRTAAGQEYLSKIGEVAAPLAAIPPIREAAIIAQTARPALQQAARASKPAIDRSSSYAKDILSSQKTQDSNLSMGAAEVDQSAMRREMAAQLPVNPKLTEGQATRDYNQLRFEQEAMKSDLGDPLRERSAFQHQAVRQSLDEWIDETGSQSSDLRSVGIAVDEAVRNRAAFEKNRIRAAYRLADERGEMGEPVDTANIVSAINDMASAESAAPVITAAKKELLRLGGATENPDGSLSPSDIKLSDAEQLRRFVNKTTGIDPTNIKFASDIKGAIDATTKNSGGDIYRQARRLRENYARKFEDRAIVSDLLDTKRGTADRKVALEDVFDRVVFRGSLDDVRIMRKTLQTSGENGGQAWRELQGAGLRYIRDEATKNITRDVNGNEMISPAALNRAITRLDSDGKLDFIYGKQGAEKLRAINDISKVLFTAPPGVVNTSNTASVLLAGLDMIISGTSGMPLPITSSIRYATKNIKDRKTKARIEKALREMDESQ